MTSKANAVYIRGADTGTNAEVAINCAENWHVVRSVCFKTAMAIASGVRSIHGRAVHKRTHATTASQAQ